MVIKAGAILHCKKDFHESSFLVFKKDKPYMVSNYGFIENNLILWVAGEVDRPATKVWPFIITELNTTLATTWFYTEKEVRKLKLKKLQKLNK